MFPALLPKGYEWGVLQADAFMDVMFFLLCALQMKPSTEE